MSVIGEREACSLLTVHDSPFEEESMKQLVALLTAIFITGLVVLGMIIIGLNALTNPTQVEASTMPPVSETTARNGSADAQIKQLQNLVQQYQQRELQYQAQLDQANLQLQQYQQLLDELQEHGLIRITPDGQILIARRRF